MGVEHIAEKFLDTYSITGNIRKACKKAGISRATYTGWKKNKSFLVSYPEGEIPQPFADAAAEALEDYRDFIEGKVHEWAVLGIEEPLIYQGEPVYKRDPLFGYEVVVDDETGQPIQATVRKRNPKLLEMMIKALKPEKYRENTKITHDVEKGGVLLMPVATPPSEWAKVAEAGQKVHRDGTKIKL